MEVLVAYICVEVRCLYCKWCVQEENVSSLAMAEISLHWDDDVRMCKASATDTMRGHILAVTYLAEKQPLT